MKFKIDDRACVRNQANPNRGRPLFAPVATPKALVRTELGLLVPSAADNTVILLDRETLERLEVVQVGCEPTTLEECGAKIFVGCWRDQALVMYDAGDTVPKVTRQLKFDCGITALAILDGKVLGALYTGGMFVLDPESPHWTEGADPPDWMKAVAITQMPAEPWMVVPDSPANRIYLPMGAGRGVAVVNSATMELVQTLVVYDYPGAVFHGAAVSDENGQVHAVFSAPEDGEKACRIAVFNEDGNLIGEPREYDFDYGGRGQMLVDGHDNLFLACSASQEVVKIGPDGTIVDRLDTNGAAYGLCMLADDLLAVGVKEPSGAVFLINEL